MGSPSDNLLASLLTASAMVLVACLTYYFTKMAEARKNLEGLRTQAYQDYMKTLANLANVKRNVKGDSISESDRDRWEFELDAEQLDARVRILLYGALPVIHALAELQETDLDLDKPKNNQVFCRMVCEMRHSGASNTFYRGIDRIRRFLGKPPLVADEVKRVLSGKQDNIRH